MMLDLRQIFEVPDTSMELNTAVSLSGIDFHGVHPFETPISVKGRIENRLGVVTVQCEVAFTLHYLCDRCLKEEYKDCRMQFSHVLCNEPNVDFSDDRIEVQGNSLDLDDLIMNDILLELPTKLLCRDDCKGLCPECGKNLNDGTCSCRKETVDPRLAVLKQLLDHHD